MSTVVIQHKPAEPPKGPLSTGPARWAAAALFVIGAALQVLEFGLENPPEDNAARVATWVDNPGQTAASMSFGLLAVPFLLGGFAVIVAITRRHSRRLATVAGALITLAMVGLAAVHGFEIAAFSLATSGHESAAISVLEGDHVVAPTIVMLLVFLGGALLGTLTLAAAMWRSPLLPRVAAAGVVVFAVLDFAVGSPVVSHLVALANSLVVAWAVVTGHSRDSR